jgi:osmoprotectant transport system substrate-binding protein
MYAQALTKAGFEVRTEYAAGSRAAYLPALRRGEIDVVPDYLAPVTDYLRAAAPARGRPAAATGDVEHTARVLDGLLAGTRLGVTRPSGATDQTAFAVPKTLADDQKLTTISDLSRLNGQLVLGGPTGCVADLHCLAGLQDRYGLRFRDVAELGEVSSKPIFEALRDGDVDVGAVRSSAGGIAAGSLVVLHDDRLLQPAGNILGLYRSAFPAPARAVVDSVNRALTTEKLQELNKRQDLDGQDPDDLAKRFLQDARLI